MAQLVRARNLAFGAALIAQAWADFLRSMFMATQIVMDHTGDTRHYFNPDDAEAVARAEKRFRKLTGAGFIAAERTSAGQSRRVTAFNPTAEETLFFPRLVGG
jgi:hypothetical protein